MELPKTFKPIDHEQKIYKLWEQSGAFAPSKAKKTFCVIMPPPNANGPLHIGHAVFVSLEDLMIRYHRMRGEAALWLPGADHAGFETQVVYEQELGKQGRSRFDLSRDELYKELWDYSQKNKATLENQLQMLGASCDWSREKFTLDPDIVGVVYKTFKKLYDDGLVYRALRPINWCIKHQTSLSDLEVKWVERKDPLYYIKYGPLTLATVRLETKFGDTAVAVHPRDKRYKKFIGKEIEFKTLIGEARMKVIADEAVDPKFGTGVIKVTPAHDPLDFEIGQRHNLEVRQVIDWNGRLNEKAGPYAGLTVRQAREKVAKDMEAKGMLEKVDRNYRHAVATCYKCGTLIEPLPRKQFFVKVKPLAEKAIAAVTTRKVTFITKHFKKIYFHWLKNIKDWNISRQIVWGIRIPAYFCDHGHVFVEIKKTPTSCPQCQSQSITQDTDTFDTWFSSGQWPFATLLTSGRSSEKLKMKNEKLPIGVEVTKDFQHFYPTTVMETGHDILFFWVARMVMLGVYATGKVPFRYVYLHGLVRDKDRQKMSKSKGNVIDPLAVTGIYGADAVRMALVFGTAAGSDTSISEEKIAGMRNFANKVWNIARFILMNLANENLKSKIENLGPKTKIDKEILKKLDATTKDVTKLIDQFRFHQAAETLYQFIWHEFADRYIEATKQKKNPAVLLHVLTTSLKLLHPFMPFVTEVIWQELTKRQLVEEPLLITAPWPSSQVQISKLK